MHTRNKLLFILLALLTAAGFIVAPYLVFFVAPAHEEMGFIQKIFYFHVPCAWAMFLSAFVSAIGAGAYLFRRREWGDRWVAAAGELTLVFGTIVLITGPLWGKKSWGHYWVWDVRLTTVLILFLIFIAVMLARRFGGQASRRIAAGLCIFGAADVPLIYISVKLWRTIHPETTVVGSLPTKMRIAFFVCLGVFTLLYVLLFWIRLRLESSRDELDTLMVAVAEKE